MKIGFIWWFDKASSVFENWRDGLRGAIEQLELDHDIGWYLDKTMPEPGEVDYLLFWSSSNEDYFNLLDKYEYEGKGICLTTNPQNVDNLRKMDAVFVESNPVLHECRALSLPVIKAFGTDTDFFKPDKSKKKDIEYFYPATFSPWKRQNDIAHLGDKLLCVGTIQPDGKEIYEMCKEAGVRIEEGYFPVEKIRDYYQRAENVIIPAVHGSERTVLEAMACGIVPEVTNGDINKKTHSFIREFQVSEYENPRDFVINNYSHYIYASNLRKGIER